MVWSVGPNSFQGPQNIGSLGDNLKSSTQYEDVISALEKAVTVFMRGDWGNGASIGNLMKLLDSCVNELKRNGQTNAAKTVKSFQDDLKYYSETRMGDGLIRFIRFIKENQNLFGQFDDRIKSITLLFETGYALKEVGQTNFTADVLVKNLQELLTTSFGKENKQLLENYLAAAKSINATWDPEAISIAWDKTMPFVQEVIDKLSEKYPPL